MICKFNRRSLVEVSFKVLASILLDSWVGPHQSTPLLLLAFLLLPSLVETHC